MTLEISSPAPSHRDAIAKLAAKTPLSTIKNSSIPIFMHTMLIQLSAIHVPSDKQICFPFYAHRSGLITSQQPRSLLNTTRCTCCVRMHGILIKLWITLDIPWHGISKPVNGESPV